MNLWDGEERGVLANFLSFQCLDAMERLLGEVEEAGPGSIEADLDRLTKNSAKSLHACMSTTHLWASIATCPAKRCTVNAISMSKSLIAAFLGLALDMQKTVSERWESCSRLQ
jgi:hypothetical protein